MGTTNLFLLLPESGTPSTRWTKSNERMLEYEELVTIIKELENCFYQISVENFDAYYDALNLTSFLHAPSIIEEYYPYPISRIIHDLFKKLALTNWRQSINLDCGQIFKIFGQSIEDHTLCAIVVHQQFCAGTDNFVLLNHSALTLTDNISVRTADITIEIPNIQSSSELFKWFCGNRLPPRKFHITSKHGENGRGHWSGASPLLCNCSHAQTLLNNAIGDESKLLFNFDAEHQAIITFWFENTLTGDGERLYHGYHVPKTSTEIPSRIRQRLLS